MLLRVVKYAAVGVFGLVFIVYASLAGLLWWGDRQSAPPEFRQEPVYVRSQQPHKFELINDGLMSLQRRIELIDGARKSIELEFFIYELDDAARVITLKLVEAAQRGVKVRLLVDFSAPVFKLGPQYASALAEKGIEVRYYNTSSLLRLFSAQHRSHRKLLIADGIRGITGGRNIGNDYFNLSEHYNFLDSDVLLEGPVVEAMQLSFEHYWNSTFATSPADVATGKEEAIKDDLHDANPRIVGLIAAVEKATAERRANTKGHVCNDLQFVTDYSGTYAYNRQVFKRLVEFLGEANSELVGESPYFVLRKDGINLLKELANRGVGQTFLTNSLASTDAWYTTSAMSLSLRPLKNANIDIRIYEGSRPQLSPLTVNSSSERWGIHAKRAVVDRKHVLIGTYNVDPRSANFNSELMLICRDNPSLAAEMLDDMNSRMAGARQLFGASENSLANLLTGAESSQKVKFALAIPLVYFFDFLL